MATTNQVTSRPSADYWECYYCEGIIPSAQSQQYHYDNHCPRYKEYRREAAFDKWWLTQVPQWTPENGLGEVLKHVRKLCLKAWMEANP